MVYKEKDAQLEDNRSTAYTFLGVGIAGLIFVILFALDIIKLPMADYMRVIMIVVMSVLFVIFLGIGITHFRKFRYGKQTHQRNYGMVLFKLYCGRNRPCQWC